MAFLQITVIFLNILKSPARGIWSVFICISKFIMLHHRPKYIPFGPEKP